MSPALQRSRKNSGRPALVLDPTVTRKDRIDRCRRIQSGTFRENTHSRLLELGIPYERVYRDNKERAGKQNLHMFSRPYYELRDLLLDARTLYRKRIKEIHPDRNGSHAEAVRLNLLWARVNGLFRRKGITLD